MRRMKHDALSNRWWHLVVRWLDQRRLKRQGLCKLPSDAIIKARDDTAAQVNRVTLTFVGAVIFCVLSLLTPDSALLVGGEKLNVPFAGPVSFFGFMLLGPAVLIVLRAYLQIYVEHQRRLDRIAQLIPAGRAPTLTADENPFIRGFRGFAFYLLLPLAILAFWWKVAVFPEWGRAFFIVGAAVIVMHLTLPFRRLPWRWRAEISLAAAIVAIAVMDSFFDDALRRRFNLVGANLSGQWLGNKNLIGADLTRANLGGVNLSGAYLSGAYLIHANLSEARLSRADLSDANLSDANLSKANLSQANLRDAHLDGADLSGAYLRDANLGHADLSLTHLDGAVLFHADLSGAYLKDANLGHADLSVADLSHANLSYAALSGANLGGANLSHANLSHANLSPPTSAAPTLASPTWTVPTSATPTSATPSSGSPTSATPTSAAPISATPTSASPISATPTSAAPSDWTQLVGMHVPDFLQALA